jgi:hypothetical protein
VNWILVPVQGLEARSCEYGDETSDCIQVREFLK